MRTVIQHEANTEGISSIISDDGTIKYSVLSPQHVIMKIIDPASGKDTILVDRFQQTGEYEIFIDKTAIAPGSFIWRYSTQTDSATLFIEDVSVPLSLAVRSDSAKRKLVAKVFRGLFNAETEPIEKRLDSINIDSIISNNLKSARIDLEYAYGVLDVNDDSMRIVEPPIYRNQLRLSNLRSLCFSRIFSRPLPHSRYISRTTALTFGDNSALCSSRQHCSCWSSLRCSFTAFGPYWARKGCQHFS